MVIRLSQNYFSPSEISIPKGEEFSTFHSHMDGALKLRPRGRFIVLEDLQRVVYGGGDIWTVTVPAGTYEMVHGGNIYSHTIIRRVGNTA